MDETNYNSFTNSELTTEMERLEQDFVLAQKASLENYALMMDLAAKYEEAKTILDKRNGKIVENNVINQNKQ